MMSGQQDINPEAFGLSRFDEVEAGRPVLDSEEEEELAKEFPEVCFVLGDRLDQGHGTLFITSRWAPSPDRFSCSLFGYTCTRLDLSTAAVVQAGYLAGSP